MHCRMATLLRHTVLSGRDCRRSWRTRPHGVSVNQNQRVNIIQHPQGRFQEIAFRDNQVKAVGENYLQYLTDTDYGTSGSPVPDDWFNVVALHNQRVPDPSNPHRWHRKSGVPYRSDVEKGLRGLDSLTGSGLGNRGA